MHLNKSHYPQRRGLNYVHQPTQPTVLKVEKTPPCASHDRESAKIEEGPVPTKMNITRFIQDFLRDFPEGDLSQYVSEEYILAKVKEFFPSIR